MDRRQFLKFVGISGTSAIATLGTHGWIAKSLAASPGSKR
ncbi:twin-arginine translocation signal domain-containing protein [Planktothrix paucivesiculata]|nr:twin-arginine translocation signal domain-containing protein [Planktothrix paucivesiculata]